MQPHRWRSRSQPLTSSYHSSRAWRSADRSERTLIRPPGDRRDVHPLFVDPSAAVGHQRPRPRLVVSLRSRVIVAHRRSSPTSRVSLLSLLLFRACRLTAFPPYTRVVRASTGAPTTVRGRFPGWCVLSSSARKRRAPCRRVGSPRPADRVRNRRANAAGVSSRPRRDDPSQSVLQVLSNRVDVNT